MGYTKEGIMAQVYVAFGQGTGEMRVSQETCLALYERYQGKLDEALKVWEDEGVQVLERIRAIGRLMASEATLQGDTTISAKGFPGAAKKVEDASTTSLCGPPPSPRPTEI